MEIGIDSAPFKELAKMLKELGGDKFDKFMKEMLLELVFRLDAKVKMRTPVDKGLLRRNWQVGEFTKKGNSYEIEYFNNTEYASHVEFGHKTSSGKTVEGVYMLTISEAELEAELIPLVEARMVAFIERTLGEMGG